MLSKWILDVHPWSDSTEFRGMGRGSSDCTYKLPHKELEDKVNFNQVYHVFTKSVPVGYGSSLGYDVISELSSACCLIKVNKCGK